VSFIICDRLQLHVIEGTNMLKFNDGTRPLRSWSFIVLLLFWWL